MTAALILLLCPPMSIRPSYGACRGQNPLRSRARRVDPSDTLQVPTPVIVWQAAHLLGASSGPSPTTFTRWYGTAQAIAWAGGFRG